jgi:GMP synthase-like glutamine amidotransferase
VAVLGIQNCDLEGFGRYADLLERWGVGVDIVRPYRDENLPPWDEFDALLVGGTPISANDVERHAFLQGEVAYLAGAVSACVPCFGICCGAQLLARILGAPIRRCEQMEIGCIDVHVTAQGSKDDVLRGFPSQFSVFQWHGDVFGLPERSRLLVEGDVCRYQMFRAESVVGVLFHLEISAGEVRRWADEYEDELASAGLSKATIVSACEAKDSAMADLSAVLLGNFFRAVARVPLAV